MFDSNKKATLITLLGLTGAAFVLVSRGEIHLVPSERLESKNAKLSVGTGETPPLFPLAPGVEALKQSYEPKWLAASSKRKVSVTWIPKVMCSSIRQSLNRIDCNQTSRCTEARKNKQVFPYFKKHLAEFTRVLFLRDPFERALSVYSNSVTNPYIFIENSPCSDSRKCSFDRWTAELKKNLEANLKNEHIRTQASIAQTGRMHYHHVLRMSNPIDQAYFWTTLLKVPAVTRNSSHNQTQPTDPVQRTMDLIRQYIVNETETFHTLAQIYRQDILLWEQALARGTPKGNGEYTFYDYYKNEILKVET